MTNLKYILKLNKMTFFEKTNKLLSLRSMCLILCILSIFFSNYLIFNYFDQNNCQKWYFLILINDIIVLILSTIPGVLIGELFYQYNCKRAIY